MTSRSPTLQNNNAEILIHSIQNVVASKSDLTQCGEFYALKVGNSLFFHLTNFITMLKQSATVVHHCKIVLGSYMELYVELQDPNVTKGLCTMATNVSMR